MSEPKKAARSTKRVMDVSHPGKSAPSASSRPVIVTNRPILKDPMMREEADKPVLPDAVAPSVSREVEVKPVEAERAKTIAQLAEEAKARVDKTEAEKAPETEEPELKPQEELTAKPEPKAEKLAESTDAVAPGAEAAADQEAKLAEAAKQDAELEKLVETKEYFLPINAVEKRRTKRVVVLGALLSVILALAWVDIALDAGLIQLDNVKPITHFFSN